MSYRLSDFDNFSRGEIRCFPGMPQDWIATVAERYTDVRNLPWKFKSWQNGRDTYLMRIDGLVEPEIEELIRNSPGPLPLRGRGSVKDILVINRHNLMPSVKPGKFTAESRHRWDIMEVGDTRLVKMIRRDLWYCLSRFLVQHDAAEFWEFKCERQRDLETPRSWQQIWIITRTQ